jgi:DNA-nicking Smr family endonuclease
MVPAHAGFDTMSKRKPTANEGAAPVPGDEERRLFEREFADVRPLRPGPTRIAPTKTPVFAARASIGAPRTPRQTQTLLVEREGSRVACAGFGVSRERLRALGRGDVRAEAFCDLHGLRAEAAAARLHRFVQEAAAQGRRSVLVICGRGLHSGPGGQVLLDVAVETLCTSALCRYVLAFSSAAPAQGGDGALMVLLRRQAGTG